MLSKDDLLAIRNLVKDEVRSSENRLVKKMELSQNEVIKEVGNFIHDTVLPQLEEKADKSDIERIERKLDTYAAETSRNATDIQEIKMFVRMPQI